MLLILALSLSADPPVYRLLIEGVQHQPDGGYRVTLVQPDSPTRKMTRADNPAIPGELEVGDVITRMDGQPLPTSASLGQLVQASGGRVVTLSVLDRRTGATIDWRVTPVRGSPAPPAGGFKVHALLVGDTLDRTVGTGCGVDVRTLTRLLTGGGHIHKSRVGTVTTLTGERATADGILKALAALPSRPQDTVLVYVSSHGAFDPKVADPLSGGHFLALRGRGGKDLPRVDVRKTLADRPGRLKLLVTDACNTKATIVRPPPAPGAMPESATGGAPPMPRPKVVSPVEKLLFAHAGRLDLTAASPGESAVGTDEAGGVFTLALVNAMTRGAGWPAVLKDATTEAKRGYQGKPQTAKVFENTLKPEAPPGGLTPLLDDLPGEWGLPAWWGR